MKQAVMAETTSLRATQLMPPMTLSTPFSSAPGTAG